MIKEDKNYVASVIENEGFENTFYGYSDFKDIQDEEFHRLRQAYLDAREKLYQYIKS